MGLLGGAARARFPGTKGSEMTKQRSEIKFFHSFELPSETIQGLADPAMLKLYADRIFQEPLTGRTVLDIGAWDGFYSFDAEKRGASRVLATDHFCWSGPGWGTKDGFNYIHKALNSKVESLDIDVPNLNPEQLGRFDTVIFLGVLYHLPDPFGGLARAAAMARDCIVVETHSDMNDIEEPVMRYYLGDELNGDGSNYWAPNSLCLENMLRELGFKRVEHFFWPERSKSCRLITHAWR